MLIRNIVDFDAAKLVGVNKQINRLLIINGFYLVSLKRENDVSTYYFYNTPELRAFLEKKGVNV